MRADNRYLSVWLRRTRRQLAPSGRLSELALILSRSLGESHEAWASRLRAILEGEHTPSLDLVTEIDAILARPRTTAPAPAAELMLL